jgi:hypothetical protein
MPMLRRRVNKTAKKLHEARKADKTEIYNGPDGPAGLIDVKGFHKVAKAQKAFEKAKNTRSKGPMGAVRKTLASKEAKKRLQNIKNIKELRKKGYVIDKPRNNVKPRKEVKHDKSTAHLIKGIPQMANVRTISKRGNIREGKLISGTSGMIFIKMGNEQVPLKADRLKSVKEIKS